MTIEVDLCTLKVGDVFRFNERDPPPVLITNRKYLIIERNQLSREWCESDSVYRLIVSELDEGDRYSDSGTRTQFRVDTFEHRDHSSWKVQHLGQMRQHWTWKSGLDD